MLQSSDAGTYLMIKSSTSISLKNKIPNVHEIKLTCAPPYWFHKWWEWHYSQVLRPQKCQHDRSRLEREELTFSSQLKVVDK